MTVGISSYNTKQHVPDEIPSHNQFIQPDDLKSQKWLEEIDDSNEKQKMMINTKKTKTMIINFTENFQFTTRMKLKDENIEVIDSTKLLGTIISKDLKWDKNIAAIVKKANARMELLRKAASFGPPVEDLKGAS